MERAAEAIQERTAARESEGLSPAPASREYHVCFDGRHWNVETDDGVVMDAALDQDLAVTLAIRAARHDLATGLDVTVCVAQQDGTSVLAWASH